MFLKLHYNINKKLIIKNICNALDFFAKSIINAFLINKPTLI